MTPREEFRSDLYTICRKTHEILMCEECKKELRDHEEFCRKYPVGPIEKVILCPKYIKDFDDFISKWEPKHDT